MLRILVLSLLLLSASYAQVVTPNLEYQKISFVGYTWKHVVLENFYSDAIVVCSNVLASSSAKEAVVRVNNVNSSGFDVKIQTPNDVDPLYSTDVYCIVSDEGSYSIPFKYEAHKVLSTATSGKNTINQWSRLGTEDVSNAVIHTYTKPAVLGQVMSYNDASFSTFWSFDCDSRSNRPFQSGMADGICVGKHVGEIAQERASEVLGYIVAEAGVYELEDFSMAVDYGADSIRGVGNSPAYSYALDKSYTHGVVTKEAEDGGQGGWAVSYGLAPFGTSLDLAIDEETVAGDTTRTHTTENVAYWVFLYDPITPAEMKINEIMYLQTVNGSTNDEFIEFYVSKSGDLKNYLFTDQDGSTHHYRFPKHSVNVGDYVVLHIGTGLNHVADNVHHFYFNISEILNNTGDEILLLKPSNTDVTLIDGKILSVTPFDYVTYTQAGDTIPTSLNGVTLSWNSTYETELTTSVKGTSLSISPNGIDSNSAACWEVTASGNAADNACTGYIITRDTNSDTLLTYSMGESNTASAKMSLTKNSCVIYDPINDINNPKRMPGAIIRYVIEVKNSGSAIANDVKVDDTLDNRFNFSTIKNLQIQNGTCDCLGIVATSNNGANGTANGINPIVLDFGDVASGSDVTPTIECGYFEVDLL